MTDIEKLITTARHYCIDQFAFWSDKYYKENIRNHPASNISGKHFDVFPRYNVLTAIRQGVETIVGQDFPTFETCKQAIIEKGLYSHSISTIDGNKDLHLLGESGRFRKVSGKQNPIEKNALADERNKFIEFILSRTSENISDVEPLPYKRKLTDQEMLGVREKLSDIWNYDGGYWDPLEKKSPKEVVFLSRYNVTPKDQNKIFKFLIPKSKKRLFAVTEDRVDYEIEFDTFNHLDLYETIVTDKTFDWVIYGSYEGTITFAGAWLTDYIKALFSDRVNILNNWE